MTREFAEELPMIELAEMLIDYSDDYEDKEAYELVEEGLDRYDTLERLESLGAFDEDND
jgi:hypothetical protein